MVDLPHRGVGDRHRLDGAAGVRDPADAGIAAGAAGPIEVDVATLGPVPAAEVGGLHGKGARRAAGNGNDPEVAGVVEVPELGPVRGEKGRERVGRGRLDPLRIQVVPVQEPELGPAAQPAEVRDPPAIR